MLFLNSVLIREISEHSPTAANTTQDLITLVTKSIFHNQPYWASLKTEATMQCFIDNYCLEENFTDVKIKRII